MSTTSQQGPLHRLSDSGLEVSDSAQDVRGREVRDASNQKIGKVDDLFIDESERHVRMLEVGSGGFLGIGRDKVLVPVDAVQQVTPDAVRINKDRTHMSGAPAYDPKLMDEETLNRTYAFYGYRPYWTQGYMYPGRWYF